MTAKTAPPAAADRPSPGLPNLLPNLLVVGAQKAGTTTLASRLASHPDVFMPPEKELNFFTRPDWRDRTAEYAARYARARDRRYRLDATPGYFWTARPTRRFADPRIRLNPDLPGAIRSLLGPEVRIIVILRHPVDRAISGFFHQFRMGRLGGDSRIRLAPERAGVVDIGFYSEHLANYFRVFPQETIRVLLFEDYIRRMETREQELLRWLGLEARALSHGPQDDNANFVMERKDGFIRIRDGIEQVRRLSGDPRYKRMPVIEPPVVEPADIAFLNAVYAGEIGTMKRLYPELEALWPSRP